MAALKSRAQRSCYEEWLGKQHHTLSLEAERWVKIIEDKLQPAESVGSARSSDEWKTVPSRTKNIECGRLFRMFPNDTPQLKCRSMLLQRRSHLAHSVPLTMDAPTQASVDIINYFLSCFCLGFCGRLRSLFCCQLMHLLLISRFRSLL